MRHFSCRATQDTKIVNSVVPVSIGESKIIALLARSQQLLAAFEILENCDVVYYNFRVRKEQADTYECLSIWFTLKQHLMLGGGVDKVNIFAVEHDIVTIERFAPLIILCKASVTTLLANFLELIYKQ